jgi:hypothetical protein
MWLASLGTPHDFPLAGPLLSLLIAQGCHIGERTVSVIDGAQWDDAFVEPDVGLQLARASFSLSVATNAASTGMIWYKSW